MTKNGIPNPKQPKKRSAGDYLRQLPGRFNKIISRFSRSPIIVARVFELWLRRYWRTVSFSMLLCTFSFFWYLAGRSSNIPDAISTALFQFKASADTLNASINLLSGSMRNQQAYNDWYHAKLSKDDSLLNARLEFLEYRVGYMAEMIKRQRRCNDE